MTIQYKNWTPTEFDHKGAYLGNDEDNRDDWYVCPCLHTRDSGPMEESNYYSCLEILGGESDTVETYSFGHWGPGWFEIILVHPSRMNEVQEIEDRLENYPLLDDDDLSARERDLADDDWSLYGKEDFLKFLRSYLEESTINYIENLDSDLRDLAVSLGMDETADSNSTCFTYKWREIHENSPNWIVPARAIVYRYLRNVRSAQTQKQ
jgi:hypothetical protein